MFPVESTPSGKSIDRDYAMTRARWEPLYEVTQTKGDRRGASASCRRTTNSPNFEPWDTGNLDVTEREDERDARVRIRALPR